MDRISVYLLGPMKVQVEDRGVDGAFRTRKERALLAYLVTEGKKQHRRELLSELFWPDRPEGYARTNLRQALLGLRRVMGGESLTVGEEYLSYSLGGETWLDTETFLSLIQSSENHPHASLENCRECASRLEEAVRLYRGDFLEDLLLPENQNFQEWVIFHREQYFRRLLGAYQSLITFFQNQSEFEQAYRYAWNYVNAAPLEEAAHRRLMSLQALSGRRSAALEQYQALSQILERELGVEPSRQTRDLYERIRSGVPLDRQQERRRSAPTNLPGLLTSFINREDEVECLRGELDNPESHLITVVGPPGAGKTRLALHCAQRSMSNFPDGVWLVDLQEVYTAKLLAARIAEVLGLPFDDAREFRTQLHRRLRSLRTLLILDPFEHLAHTTGFVLELLQQAPDLKIVLTSRRRLNYQAACPLEIAGLTFPGERQPGRAESYAAVQLFLARAQQNRSPVPDSEAAMQMVMEICRRLDGLPLAIELAAAALREHSLGYVLDGVRQGLDVLKTDLEDVPETHRSLRAALDSSWSLLNDEEQEAFQRLSTFTGEFSAEEGRLLAGASPAVLDALAAYSLLQKIKPNRYRLYAPMRLYAAEKLAESSPEAPNGRISFQDPPLRRKPVRVRTGPLNLELFSDRLEQTLARAIRYQHTSALILLDIHRWAASATKNEGESRALIRLAGQRITESLRGADTVSYLGEGRFAIVLDELANPRDTQVVVNKLFRNLEALAAGSQTNLLRLGISLYPQDGMEVSKLYSAAQEQLLSA